MLANKGSTFGTRGPPQSNAKPTFSLSMWLIMFGAFLMKFPLVYAAFQMEVLNKETPGKKQNASKIMEKILERRTLIW